MLMAIEEPFKFKILDSEAQSLVTVGDLYELVKKDAH
jgi:acyl carrier protein